MTVLSIQLYLKRIKVEKLKFATSSLGKSFQSAFTSETRRGTLSKAIQKNIVHDKLKRLVRTFEVLLVIHKLRHCLRERGYQGFCESITTKIVWHDLEDKAT